MTTVIGKYSSIAFSISSLGLRTPGLYLPASVSGGLKTFSGEVCPCLKHQKRFGSLKSEKAVPVPVPKLQRGSGEDSFP